MRFPTIYAPRYWPTWIGVGLHAMLAWLPYGLQLRLGRRLGRLGLRLAKRRRRIAVANLARCFPELNPAQREALLRAHFESLGIGIIEMASCWWGSGSRLKKRVQVSGLTHLTRALESGRGAILLTAHFTTLELGGRLLGFFHPVQAVYRRHENPVLDRVMRSRRRARSAGIIERGDLRTLLRALRQGAAVWYAPDQAYLGPHGVEAPFFGVPAPTNTATARLAAAGNTPVLPFFVERLPGTAGYRLRIEPALKAFPGGDPKADATRVNQALEPGIRSIPAQYLWCHDRFKQFRRD